jgi:hypothetical protein
MITQKGFCSIVDRSTGLFFQQSYHHYYLMTIFGNKIDTMRKSLFFYSGKIDMAKHLLWENVCYLFCKSTCFERGFFEKE